MSKQKQTNLNGHKRAVQAILDVLPRAAVVDELHDAGSDLVIGGQPIKIEWVGEGSLGRVRNLLAHLKLQPNIVVARHLSLGAKEVLSTAGIGWVDETGAAEIALGHLVISRSGRPSPASPKPDRWTPSVLAVTEAVICGTRPTVADTHTATGLSVGSCTNALRFLSQKGLLVASAPRGRSSAREITDHQQLLESYATAAAAMDLSPALTVGTVWRDPIAGLIETGQHWSAARITWAATGLAAAAVTAPLITNVASVEVYVQAKSLAGLEAIAAKAGLRPIDGGRLTLRPFPTITTARLATVVEEMHVAPWPRVFVDLRCLGVRGEKAAEHLREVIRGI